MSKCQTVEATEIQIEAKPGTLEDQQGEQRQRGSSTTRWRRVALSGRDWEILTWAHEQKFLTFEQVARWFPDQGPNPRARPRQNPTRGTLRRRERPGNWYLSERLRKLVRFDVLRRVPVFTEGAAALVPGRVGYDLLVGTGRSSGLCHVEAIDWKNFAHDRTATDLRWLFERRLGGSWRSERVLRRDLNVRQVPDAIVTLQNRAIALEVELTRKSVARYLGIIERYVAWPGPPLDSVLYVTPGEPDLRHLFSTVLPAALRSPSLWRTRQANLSLFRFTTLKALPSGKVWWTITHPNQPTEGQL